MNKTKFSITHSRIVITIALVVIGLAFALRLWRLSHGMDLRETDELAYIAISENFQYGWKPTLYYNSNEGHFSAGFLLPLLGYFVGLPLGNAALGMRLVNWAATVIIAIGLWYYGRSIGNARLGILAAIFFALNPLSIYMARQGLLDTLTSLWLLLGFWTLDRAIRSHRSMLALAAGIIMGLLTLTKPQLTMIYGVTFTGLVAIEWVWISLKNKVPGLGWLPGLKPRFTTWGRGLKLRPFLIGMAVIIVPPFVAFFIAEPARFTWSWIVEVAKDVPMASRLLGNVASFIAPFIPKSLLSQEQSTAVAETLTFVSHSWIERPQLFFESAGLLFYPYLLPLRMGWPGFFLFLVGTIFILRYWQIRVIRLVAYYAVLLIPLLLTTFPHVHYITWLLPGLAILAALGADTLLNWLEKEPYLSPERRTVFAIICLFFVISWMGRDAYNAWWAQTHKTVAQQVRDYLIVEKGLPRENTIIFSDFHPINLITLTGYRSVWLTASQHDALKMMQWIGDFEAPQNQMQYLHENGGVVILSPLIPSRIDQFCLDRSPEATSHCSLVRAENNENWPETKARQIPYHYVKQQFKPTRRFIEQGSYFPEGYGDGILYYVDIYIIPPKTWGLLLELP